MLSFIISVNLSCDEKVEPEIQDSIAKPTGVFSASGSMSENVIDHEETRGVLIRATWKDIEPTEGNFNFSSIDKQINSIKAKGKSYSLGILAGGIGSPDWLIDQKGASYYDYLFHSEPYRLPLIWDSTVLNSLKNLSEKLADRYTNDSALLLIYIPQMTANGIEGHLNGFDESSFKSAGYTEKKWINASIENAKNFAASFPNKALAFEVHDIFGSTIPASSIINSLWHDTSLNHRVGAAMWWISGRSTYQPNLIAALETFPGDIYCQVISPSHKTADFPDGDYRQVFAQAKKLRARYIEPWEDEFSINSWSSDLHDFNSYADELRKY